MLVVGCKTTVKPSKQKQVVKKAIKVPPPPPGYRVSLNPPMPSSPPFVVPGFSFSSIVVTNGQVTLAWNGGVPPFQIEQSVSPNGPWTDTGEVTSNRTVTFTAELPQAFYRVEQATPIFNWSTSFGANTASFSDGATASSARYDNDGNVIISGSFNGNNSFPGGPTLTNLGGQDFFIAKYSPQGSLIWAKGFGSINNESCTASMVDGRNDLIIAGTFTGTLDFGGTFITSAETTSMYLAKYSTTGEGPVLQWVKQWGGAQNCYGVSIDSSYNIFITGGFGFYGSSVNFGGGWLPFSGGSGGYNVYVAKLDSSGNHMWSHGYGGAGNNVGFAIRTSYQNDPVIVGQFESNASFGGTVLTNKGDKDIFIAKYNGTNGNHMWSKGIGGKQSDVANGVSVDITGDVAVTGSFQGTVDFGDGLVTTFSNYAAFLVVYDEQGKYKWTRLIQPIYGGQGSSVTYDYNGSITVVGSATGLADYGNGTYVGGGTANCFIAKYLAFNGLYLSALVQGGAGNSGMFTSASSITKNSVLATGSFSGSIDFGFGPMTSPGALHGFLVKLP